MYEPSEAAVEAFLREQIKALDGEAYKFVSPGRKDVPDRLCVLPQGVIVFVEVKRPGKRPSSGQTRELQRLVNKGHMATWVDSTTAVLKLIKEIKEIINERTKHNTASTEHKQSHSEA